MKKLRKKYSIRKAKAFLLKNNICSSLFKTPNSIAGYRWIFHLNDIDPWPSSPHGHAVGKPYKLSMDGGVYNEKTRKYIFRASPKEMNELKNNVKFKEFCKEFKKNKKNKKLKNTTSGENEYLCIWITNNGRSKAKIIIIK